VRIIAGRFRGRRLASLGKGDAEAHLRPTPDRVRESLFSILTHMDAVEDAVVLDLFAGTGALGLEALSRGAASVTFIERGRIAQRLITENIRLTGAEAARLLPRDATRPGPCDGPPATLVFLDPPYGQGLGTPALAAAADGGWIAPGAIVVWEEATPQDPPPGFALTDRRRFGDTHLTFLNFGNPGAA
jgi:16S rRNA (guanine966-N2)-methyltransferase